MNYSQARQVLESQEAAQAVLRQYEKLSNAHEEYGFSSRREFLQALEELEANERPRRGSRGLPPETVDRILRLKAEGKSNTAISRETKVSPLTVAKYVKAQKPAAASASAPASAPAPKAKAKAKGRGRAKKK